MTAFLQWVASKPLGRVLNGATIGLPIGYGIGSLAFNPYFQRWWADHWPMIPVVVLFAYPAAWFWYWSIADWWRKRRREP